MINIKARIYMFVKCLLALGTVIFFFWGIGYLVENFGILGGLIPIGILSAGLVACLYDPPKKE